MEATPVARDRFSSSPDLGPTSAENYWVKHHPAKCFPREHAIGELRHQVEELSAVIGGTPDGAIAVPVGPVATVVSEGDQPATMEPVVGIAIEPRPQQFAGSAMLFADHRHFSSYADQEDLSCDADDAAQLYFQAYADMYHKQPRYKYAGERDPPSDMAHTLVHAQYKRLLAQSASAAGYAAAAAQAAQSATGEDGLSEQIEAIGMPSHVRKLDVGSHHGKSQLLSNVESTVWAGNEHLLSVGRDGAVRVLHARTGACRGLFRANSRIMRVCAGCCDDQSLPPSLVAVGGLKNDVELWSGDKSMRMSGYFLAPTLARNFSGHVGYVSALEFVNGGGSSHGARLLSGSGDGTVRVWDVQTGQSVLGLLGHRADVTGAAVAHASSGPLVATSSLDSTARVWDLRTGGCVRRFECSDLFDEPAVLDSPPTDPEAAEEGVDALSYASTPAVRLNANQAEACDITSDGRLLAVAMRAGWATFDLRRYACVGSCTASGGSTVTSVAFMHDGATLLVGGSEPRPGRGALISAVDPLAPWLKPLPPTTQVYASSEGKARLETLRASPDGQTVASSTVHGEVRLWELVHKPQEQIELAHADAKQLQGGCGGCCTVA